MTGIEEVRERIAKIDCDIIELIAQRNNLARDILESKKELNISINDDTQNHVVMDRATNMATERNLDSKAVSEIFRILIRMNIERQHELSGEGNLP
jgi:chorismate mutase